MHAATIFFLCLCVALSLCFLVSARVHDYESYKSYPCAVCESAYPDYVSSHSLNCGYWSFTARCFWFDNASWFEVMKTPSMGRSTCCGGDSGLSNLQYGSYTEGVNFDGPPGPAFETLRQSKASESYFDTQDFNEILMINYEKTSAPAQYARKSVHIIKSEQQPFKADEVFSMSSSVNAYRFKFMNDDWRSYHGATHNDMNCNFGFWGPLLCNPYNQDNMGNGMFFIWDGTMAGTGAASNVQNKPPPCDDCSYWRVFARRMPRTLTMSDTLTLTATETETNTLPRTLTPSSTLTPVPPPTPSASSTLTPPKVPTQTASQVPSATVSHSASITKVKTMSISLSKTKTQTRTLSSTPSLTDIPTLTRSLPRTITVSPRRTPSVSLPLTVTQSITRAATTSPSLARTISLSISVTRSKSRSIINTITSTLHPSATHTISPTVTPSSPISATQTISHSKSSSGILSETVTHPPTQSSPLTLTSSIVRSASKSLSLTNTVAPTETRSITKSRSYTLQPTTSKTIAPTPTESAPITPSAVPTRTKTRNTKSLSQSMELSKSKPLTHSASVIVSATLSLTPTLQATISHTVSPTHSVVNSRSFSISPSAEIPVTRTISISKTKSVTKSISITPSFAESPTSSVLLTPSVTTSVSKSKTLTIDPLGDMNMAILFPPGSNVVVKSNGVYTLLVESSTFPLLTTFFTVQLYRPGGIPFTVSSADVDMQTSNGISTSISCVTNLLVCPVPQFSLPIEPTEINATFTIGGRAKVVFIRVVAGPVVSISFDAQTKWFLDRVPFDYFQAAPLRVLLRDYNGNMATSTVGSVSLNCISDGCELEGPISSAVIDGKAVFTQLAITSAIDIILEASLGAVAVNHTWVTSPCSTMSQLSPIPSISLVEGRVSRNITLSGAPITFLDSAVCEFQGMNHSALIYSPCKVICPVVVSSVGLSSLVLFTAAGEEQSFTISVSGPPTHVRLFSAKNSIAVQNTSAFVKIANVEAHFYDDNHNFVYHGHHFGFSLYNFGQILLSGQIHGGNVTFPSLQVSPHGRPVIHLVAHFNSSNYRFVAAFNFSLCTPSASVASIHSPDCEQCDAVTLCQCEDKFLVSVQIQVHHMKVGVKQVLMSGVPCQGVRSNVSRGSILASGCQLAEERNEVEIVFRDNSVAAGLAVIYEDTSLLSPAITAVTGCLDAYPSTGGCPFEPTLPLTIHGRNLNSPTTEVSFVGKMDFPCDNLILNSSSLIVCMNYTAFGDKLNISIQVNGSVYTNSLVQLGFIPSLAYLCPLNSSGYPCGFGHCQPTTGQCVCRQSAQDGFWSGYQCETCLDTYGGPLCQQSCPTDVNGTICSGWGYCNQTSATCQCFEGRRGALCELQCPVGVSGICSGHGVCLDNGQCQCHNSSTEGYWDGLDCAVCWHGMVGVSCKGNCPMASGVICNGKGQCVGDNFCQCNATKCGTACELSGAFCLCAPGTYGPSCIHTCPGGSGNVCNGHGLCNDGEAGDGRCTCAEGYAGSACQLSCAGTPHCSAHGTCDPLSAVCTCFPYYASSSCEIVCPGSPVVCSGHGTCLDGVLGDGTCLCNSGYTGSDCAKKCPGKYGQACSGHGTCESSGCKCHQSPSEGYWDGEECSTCLKGYFDTDCNTTCVLGTNGKVCSGHGQCQTGLICKCVQSSILGYWNHSDCGNCANGYYGNSCVDECLGGGCTPCSMNGACFHGLFGNGSCVCHTTNGASFGNEDCSDCAAGFAGESCDLLCPLDSNGGTCGHGFCDDGLAGDGKCICNSRYDYDVNGACTNCLPGYFGASCRECPGGALAPCNHHGNCVDGVIGSGACSCAFSYQGTACEYSCPVDNGAVCGGHGVCLNGTCACDIHWNISLSMNSTCSICQFGRFGSNCEFPCTALCVHGRCDDGQTGTGECLCDSGYWGTDCSSQCEGGTIPECSGHGTCSSSDGTCSCFASSTLGFFDGQKCDRCLAAYESDACSIACPVVNGLICNGRGACHNGQCVDCHPNLQLGDDESSVVCGSQCEILGSCPALCSAGFWGDCTKLCPGASPTGEGFCSDAGYCGQDTGKCRCFLGFGGDQCQFSCPVADGELCSARGTCLFTSAIGSCECDRGYTGSACQHTCPGSPHSSPCNASGQCLNDGTCRCFDGYAGKNCDIVCNGGASNPCSRHGRCLADGTCLCYENSTHGYHQGGSCEKCSGRYAESNCDVECSFFAVPTKDHCYCFEGYAARDCGLICPGNAEEKICSAHGTCLDGYQGDASCTCDKNYYTEDCSVYCNHQYCQREKNMLNPVCAPGNGTCLCQDNKFGHFTGSRCDECKLFWWGANCQLGCACNMHGGCDRDSGQCQCFQDPDNGYWAGEQCSYCSDGYIGIDCKSINIQMSTNTELSTEYNIQLDDTVPVFSFYDEDFNVLLFGNKPIVMFNMSVSPPTAMAELLLNFSVSALVASSSEYWMVTVDNSSSSSLLRTPRALPFSLDSGTSNRRLEVESLRRRAFFIPAHPVHFQLIAVSSGSLLLISNSGKISCLDGPCDGLVYQAPNITFVHQAFLHDDHVILVGYNVTKDWVIAFSSLPLVSPQWVILNQQEVPLPNCNFYDAKCKEVLYCLLQGKFSQQVQFFCVVRHVDGPMPALLTYPDYSVVLAEVAVLAPRSSEINVTTMTIDVFGKLGIFAYNVPLLPSNIVKVNISTMLITGSFSLSFVGSEPERAHSISLRSIIRETLIHVKLSFSLKIISFNLFGIRRVTPSTIDSRGGTSITVEGEGFLKFAPPVCDFGDEKQRAPATVINEERIVCVSPKSGEDVGSCSRVNFNLRFGNRSTMTSNVPVARPLEAQLQRVVTAGGGAFGSTFNVTRITIVGFGFVDSPDMSCQVVDAIGRQVFRVVRPNVEFLNSTAIVCIQPSGLEASVPPAYLWYTHDGQVFSASRLEFAVVGPSSSLVIGEPRSGYLTMRAAAVAPLPAIFVHVADLHGNSVFWLDDTIVNNGPRSVTARLLLEGGVNDRTVFVNDSFIADRTTSGIAVFDRLALAAPKVGYFSIVYLSSVGALEISTLLTVNIIVGTPHQLQFFFSNNTKTWFIGTRNPNVLKPSAEIAVGDSAGNSIQDVTLIPSLVTASWIRHVPNGSNLVNNFVEEHPSATAFVGRRGTFIFPEIATRGYYGGVYAIQFSAPAAWDLRIFRTLSIALERCIPVFEYGHPGTMECRPCPTFGICDGSPQVNVEAGHWRASPTAYRFYSCQPPYSSQGACGNGTCRTGYTGPRCSVCVNGYGKSGLVCQRCPKLWINIVMCVLIVLAIIAVLYLLVINSIREGAVEDSSSQSNIFPILVKMLINHLQVSSQAGAVIPNAPGRLLDLFKYQSSVSTVGDFNIVFVDCLAKVNYYGKFIGVLFLPLALLLIFFLLMALRSYYYQRRSSFNKRLKEEFEVPQDQARSHRAEVLDAQAEDFDLFDEFDKTQQDVMEETMAKTQKTEALTQKENEDLTATFGQIIAVTSVVLLFLLYPTILETCGKVLQCESFDFGASGWKKVLVVDRSIDCNSDAYYRLRWIATLCLVSIAVGIPVYSVFAVKSVSLFSLHGNDERAKFLFFFMTGGFEPKLWFWESIIMIRKASILIIVVVVTEPVLKSYCTMWCVEFFLALNVMVAPFEDRRLSILENCSLTVIAITLNAGQVFELLNPNKHVVQYEMLSWFVFIINVVIIAVFVYFALYGLYFAIRTMYEKDPDALWFISCCVERFKASAVEEEKEHNLEIEDLNRQIIMWEQMSEEALGRDKYVYEALGKLKSEFPHDTSANEVATSYMYVRKMVDHAVSNSTFEYEDALSLFQQEETIFMTLKRLRLAKENFAAIEEAKKKKRQEVDDRKLAMLKKFREDKEEQEKFMAPFSHLRERGMKLMTK